MACLHLVLYLLVLGITSYFIFWTGWNLRLRDLRSEKWQSRARHKPQTFGHPRRGWVNRSGFLGQNRPNLMSIVLSFYGCRHGAWAPLCSPQHATWDTILTAVRLMRRVTIIITAVLSISLSTSSACTVSHSHCLSEQIWVNLRWAVELLERIIEKHLSNSSVERVYRGEILNK